MSNKPLKSVWVVAVVGEETYHLVDLCASKKLAVELLFKERDKLVAKWNGLLDYLGSTDTMFLGMIDALSNDDYESWDNYPHDKPVIFRRRINYG